MKIDIVEREPVNVVCLRYSGAPGEPLGRFWRNVVAPWLADHGLLDCPRYGVVRDVPLTPTPEQCRYDACVAVPHGLAPPDANEAALAGGRYAIIRFKGTGRDIGAAWGEFFGACAAQQLRVDLSRPAFEHYPRGATFDPKTGVFACELCIPVGS